MGVTYVAGDFHVGHRGIHKSRPRFSTAQEHDDFIFSLLEPLRKQDTLLGVGDMFLNRESLYLFRKLPFRKKLVLGNHDTDFKCDIRDLVEVWDSIDESVKRPGGFIFTHRPMHPYSLRNKTNVHAHEHTGILRDSRYVNVSLEIAGFRLIQLEEILSGQYTTYDRG